MQPNLSDITGRIFQIKTEKEFQELALEIFRFQSEENLIYKKYIHQLGRDSSSVNTIEQIPFLPIEFFKAMSVMTSKSVPEIIFTSSGTTGAERSHHDVADVTLYEKSFRNSFRLFYGNPTDYCILALLPSYLERQGSSLIYMMNDLIQKSGQVMSGFYLDNHDELAQTLLRLKDSGQKTILLGVTFALLDFIEKHSMKFPDLVVMETGGMKGRRKEIIREELHAVLCHGFGVAKVHSEYGMTELLSQAYSSGDGIFKSPPWMRILFRDTNDPLNMIHGSQTGGINVIDLANIFSICFIATQDLGKEHFDNNFEIFGRFDDSDIRGCNLMMG